MCGCCRLQKANGDAGTGSPIADQMDLSLMNGRCMFDDGQTQARSSGLPGVTFIHAIKSFKDTALMLQRNTNTIVLHRQADP